ncbi:Chaperone DnaJ [Yasminevirus sp. GU-2018]|uniref:Chaperone DnaJ n=1 Tax=Yasminevirus sp. GU-2018 TaxID=2420051 RepID=A0A5K0UAC7_9VIRU|nr:Chaperone DnaJ [Yasminevirus sp. GU-2018]
MLSQCPFCRSDNLVVGANPYAVDIVCISCSKVYHYIYCDHCCDALCLTGARKNADLAHHNLKYRSCPECRRWNTFQLKGENNILVCTCGARADKLIYSEMFGTASESLLQEITDSERVKILPLQRSYKGRNRLHAGTVYVTLEEMFTGCTKTYKHGDNTLTIQVQPGHKAGTKFTFADQSLGKYFYNVYDVVVTLDQLEHKFLTRQDSNVVYNYDASTFKPGKRYRLSIPYLDGLLFSMTIDESIVRCGTVIIPEKGFINRKTMDTGHLMIRVVNMNLS